MRFLVSGLVNIETTLAIEGFPLEYFPVRYPFGGVSSTVSGVGFNLAAALRALGDEPRFLSLLGRDLAGREALEALAGLGIDGGGLLALLEETPRSVILYDPSGRRQIHVDLKDIQERSYPGVAFTKALAGVEAALLCNVNFNRALLPLARKAGIPICTDVHVLSDPKDAYNADFMAGAEVLFLSDEGLWTDAPSAAVELMGLYRPRILVIGRGAEGALLLERGRDPVLLPARPTRPVLSTIGAGDALFSSFIHYHFGGMDAVGALERAILFASWKIGAKGAAEGLPSAEKVEALHRDGREARAEKREGK